MFTKYFVMQLVFLALMLGLLMPGVTAYKRNYEAKYTKSNVPLWKQRACEKAQKNKANSHYICDDTGDFKCLPGWQGDLCQVPMCRKGCDPMNGYCQRPGECRCRIGYSGELCDKCIPLPGCQHGDCTKPFECICRPGWDGLFCTEPSCRSGCHNTRGYCEAPGECRCRLGWAGRNCSDCAVMPGCQHGTCSKPLECLCLPGYTGLLCQTPICNAECHKQHGWCKKPGECRCKVGWTGPKCDQCFPYPGCVNGDCEKPWECNCKPGWGGILCDEELSYCKQNPQTCENGGKCLSLTKEDGNYHCYCKQGYLGKNCEIVDEFLLTSTSAPRITPPPLIDWDREDEEEVGVDLSFENEVQNPDKIKEEEKKKIKEEVKEKDKENVRDPEIVKKGEMEGVKVKQELTNNKHQPEKEILLNNWNQSLIENQETEALNGLNKGNKEKFLINSNKTVKPESINQLKVDLNLEQKVLEQDLSQNSSLNKIISDKLEEFMVIPTTGDIIGTGTFVMDLSKPNDTKRISNKNGLKTSNNAKKNKNKGNSSTFGNNNKRPSASNLESSTKATSSQLNNTSPTTSTPTTSTPTTSTPTTSTPITLPSTSSPITSPAAISSSFSSLPPTASTPTKSHILTPTYSTAYSSTFSPLSQPKDDKNLPTLSLKPLGQDQTSNKKPEAVKDKDTEEEDDEDEECTEDDNDEDCEYVDEDEEDK